MGRPEQGRSPHGAPESSAPAASGTEDRSSTPPVAGDGTAGPQQPAEPTDEAAAAGHAGTADERAPVASDDTKHGSGSGAGAFFRELPILILVAFLLAFLLRTFVLQVFFIPSSSMEPTLQIDDRMVVEKVTFRFRDVQRGDVVVFEGEGESLTAPPSGGDRFVRAVGQFLGVIPTSARDFVKRVIATGGDEVRIEDGQVFVNGAPLDEPYVVFGDQDNYGPVTIPDDELFFLGDNRPNSSDSRRSLGFVSEASVVGRAVVVIWPLENWDSLTGVEHVLEDPDPDADGSEPDPGDADPVESEAEDPEAARQVVSNSLG